MINGEKLTNLPCDTCAHSKVCVARERMPETEIKTTHPFFKVEIRCSEYVRVPTSIARQKA